MMYTAGAVAAKFPGVPLDMTYEATPTSTGKFEVTVNGELVFSKLAGNGFPDTASKLGPIFEAISAAIA
ncbi:selenoprotein W1, partial [Haematococcus lacustris]